MPIPKGWTMKEAKERDRIAEKLMKEKRFKKPNAYALATWIINRRRGKNG